ncbi:MAG: pyridoxamine 5'-phosphate oxidase family protein [Chitinophagaceae bacterium]|nr:pyridoxamine 5'-phosphate oxidase family protein [Chitinophagaceae bacterium]
MIGQLSGEQIEEVLLSNVLGRIGCNDGWKNYVVPINYVYDGQHIIGHSVAGMKIRMMRKNPEVCFEVEEVKSFSGWKTVILWGEYEEIKDEKEKLAAMKFFVDRMMRMKISETAVPPEISADRVHPRSPGNIKPVIYRIVIKERTGRYEKS